MWWLKLIVSLTRIESSRRQISKHLCEEWINWASWEGKGHPHGCGTAHAHMLGSDLIQNGWVNRTWAFPLCFMGGSSSHQPLVPAAAPLPHRGPYPLNCEPKQVLPLLSCFYDPQGRKSLRRRGCGCDEPELVFLTPMKLVWCGVSNFSLENL